MTSLIKVEFTKSIDDEPLVLAPEVRDARSKFKFGDNIAQQMQPQAPKREAAAKLTEALTAKKPEVGAGANTTGSKAAKASGALSGLAGGSGTAAGGAMGGASLGHRARQSEQ